MPNSKSKITFHKVIYTVGYEGRSLGEMADLLRTANVETLIDARYRAQSRKAGFSKSRLAAFLGRSNIGYEHRKDLGTPPELMQELRDSGHYEMEAYARYLDDHPEIIKKAAAELDNKRLAILCYEKDATKCHRSVVAERLAKIMGATVEHL